MKELIKTIILTIVLFLAFVPCVSAQEENKMMEDFKKQYDELLEESGANRLFADIPNDAKDLLHENNIDSIDSKDILDIGFFDFVRSVWQTTKKAVTKPLTVFLSSIGVILLCALLNSLKSGFNDASYEKVFSVVSVICIATTIIVPIAQMITKTADVIKQVSAFLLSFIPVYVGIITTSGKPISAMTYSASLAGVVQVISRISASVLVPLLAIYLAFCLIGSTSTQINIDGIARAVKNTVIVVLSFLMTIFIGLLTVQGVVATSADTVSMKATKFALTAFLPVVGAAISEALNSVQGCMGVIKSTVGGFGIIAVIAAFLPSIITVMLMQLSLSVTGAISDMLATDRITSLLKAASSVLSLLLGILLVFFVLLTVSITIMLTLSTGVS